ncbi:MAG: hypothetical protein ACLTBC_10930 [Pilosibacter sp.]
MISTIFLATSVTKKLDHNKNIKKYIMEKHGVKVHTAYIAEIKRDCELDMRPNYNVSKKEEPVIKSCTPEKREYIMEALRYYRLVV